jgi:hypothetical protein
VTAAAAGAVLCALWFVPSANATVESDTTASQTQMQPGESAQGLAQQSITSSESGSESLSLADTGSVDTTPYLLGGTTLLGCGAALVAVAGHRSRSTAV